MHKLVLAKVHYNQWYKQGKFHKNNIKISLRSTLWQSQSDTIMSILKKGDKLVKTETLHLQVTVWDIFTFEWCM